MEAAARLQGSADLFDKAWDSGLPGNLACGRRPALGLNSVSSPSGVSTSKIVDDSLWHHPPYQDSACAARSVMMLRGRHGAENLRGGPRGIND